MCWVLGILDASDARASVDFIAWRRSVRRSISDVYANFIFWAEVTALPLTFQRSRYPVVQRIKQMELILASRRLRGCNQRAKRYCIVDSSTVSFLDRDVPKGEFLCVKKIDDRTR